MRVFLAGASGFIGSHILDALLLEGHEVTCLVRAGSRLHLRAEFELVTCTGSGVCLSEPGSRSSSRIRVVEAEWQQPDTWLAEVEDCDAVINAVGIIRESAQASFRRVHTDVPVELFRFAEARGVAKIVQVSALGAEAECPSTEFLNSKRRADLALARSNMTYAILRPSFVYGVGAKSMQLFSRLACLPVVPVPGDGRFLVQPVHVDDLARCVVLALSRSASVNCGVGGSQRLSFSAMLLLIASEYRRVKQSGSAKRGWGAPQLLSIPISLLALSAKATDISRLGPINSEELRMLQQGSYVQDGDISVEQAFGFLPKPFHEGVRSRIF